MRRVITREPSPLCRPGCIIPADSVAMQEVTSVTNAGRGEWLIRGRQTGVYRRFSLDSLIPAWLSMSLKSDILLENVREPNLEDPGTVHIHPPFFIGMFYPPQEISNRAGTIFRICLSLISPMCILV